MPKGVPNAGYDERQAVIGPDNTEYPTMAAAARVAGVTKDTMRHKCLTEGSAWRFKIPREVKRKPKVPTWPQVTVSPEEAYAGFSGY